ncbi:MAG: type II toxin-antitoxin system HicB family antitoxin [Lachnospiraceae bacterium]|nr:type II toxin-antitoxin system HicB family antitoxin [Lachnospiraceae bacterium]
MAKYAYPAVFTEEDEGRFSVLFPDLEGCYTCGDNLANAIYMAEDVLAFTLYDYEKRKANIPEPSDIVKMEHKKNEFTSYILCDTIEYHKKNNSKAIKKTLTIPEYLNELAIAANLNFSQILQDALKSKLGIA